MRWMSADLVDPNGAIDWWKALVRHFTVPGDAMEIRCWKEQPEIVSQAARYGAPEEDGYEVSVHGTVSREFLAELLAEEPVFADGDHKQTKYFTVNIERPDCLFSSSHYGTQLYVRGPAEELDFLAKTLAPYGDRFSIGTGEERSA